MDAVGYCPARQIRCMSATRSKRVETTSRRSAAGVSLSIGAAPRDRGGVQHRSRPGQRADGERPPGQRFAQQRETCRQSNPAEGSNSTAPGVRGTSAAAGVTRRLCLKRKTDSCGAPSGALPLPRSGDGFGTGVAGVRRSPGSSSAQPRGRVIDEVVTVAGGAGT